MIYKVTAKVGTFYIDAQHVNPHLHITSDRASDFAHRRDVLKTLTHEHVTDWEMIEDSDVPVGVSLYVPWTAGPDDVYAKDIPTPGTAATPTCIAPDGSPCPKCHPQPGTATNPLTTLEAMQAVFAWLDSLPVEQRAAIHAHTAAPFLPSLADINREYWANRATPAQAAILADDKPYTMSVQRVGRGKRTRIPDAVTRAGTRVFMPMCEYCKRHGLLKCDYTKDWCVYSTGPQSAFPPQPPNLGVDCTALTVPVIVAHLPSCRSDYPEKPSGEPARRITKQDIGDDQFVYTCCDCGAFTLVNGAGQVLNQG